MIDHVSVGVRSLERSLGLYDPVLTALGYAKLVVRPRTIGFGKRHAELWLNLRPALPSIAVERLDRPSMLSRAVFVIWYEHSVVSRYGIIAPDCRVRHISASSISRLACRRC